MLPGQAFEFISKNLVTQKIHALSSRDFAVLAGLSRGFDDLKVEDPNIISPAAVYAVLPRLASDLFTKEFGENGARLFRELQKLIPEKAGPMSFQTPGMELHHLVDAACNETDEALSFAAQGVLAGRVAAATFQEKVDLETAFNGRRATFRSILDDLRAKIDALQDVPAPPIEPMWFITFSIDIVGSTEGKTRMLAVTKDEKVLEQAYKDFHRGFLFQEDRFYQSLLRKPYAHLVPPALDLSKLYVIKGIGDEVWGIYLVPKDNTQLLREATERLVLAGLDLVKGQVMWGAKETDRPFDPMQSAEERSDAIQHPIKMCIDLIEDGYETSGPRRQYFNRQMPNYLALSGNVLTSHEVLDRLNAGFSMAAGTNTIQSIRPDYIGHEIDRFFRVGKAAMAMVVTMGESLFVKVNYSTKLTGYPGLFRADWSNTPGQNALPLKHNTRLYMQEELAVEDLKGIGYSYRVYHFIEVGQLGIFHNMPYFNPHMVAKTLATFPKEMFLKLFSPAARERYDESVKALAKNAPAEES